MVDKRPLRRHKFQTAACLFSMRAESFSLSQQHYNIPGREGDARVITVHLTKIKSELLNLWINYWNAWICIRTTSWTIASTNNRSHNGSCHFWLMRTRRCFLVRVSFIVGELLDIFSVTRRPMTQICCAIPISLVAVYIVWLVIARYGLHSKRNCVSAQKCQKSSNWKRVCMHGGLIRWLMRSRLA